MNKNRIFTPGRLKIVFYVVIILLVLLIGYRIYLAFFKEDFSGIHAVQIEHIQKGPARSDDFSFVVVGNINNSLGVFEKKMVPAINKRKPAFVISAGNAVSGGGEDKYQSVYKSLRLLSMPYLLTVGEHEGSTFGSYHFYEHFGPYFYAFTVGNSQFIFLDCTDPDTFRFQLLWLEQHLRDPGPRHRFVCVSRPIVEIEAAKGLPIDMEDRSIQDDRFKKKATELFETYGVTAVFSADLPVFDHQVIKGIHYVTTGGAGGLLLHTQSSYCHYVEVTIKGDQVTISDQPLDIGQPRVVRTLESVWFFIQSLFYVGWFNFLLLLLVLAALSIKLYTTVFVDRDYYPNFDIDASEYKERSLRVAMITDNYFPFIGGVPVSIDRLHRGLRHLLYPTIILAPKYPGRMNDHGDVVRIPSLLPWGRNSEFRMSNIFSPHIGRTLDSFNPDIIHSHHPYWTGWAAIFHARRMKVPLIYTYHTRLEHYAHFVPLPAPLFRNIISHSLIRYYANRSDGVIVPTQAAEEYLRVIGVKSDIYVQPTGIDYEAFQKNSKETEEKLRQRYSIEREVVLVSVSRLSKEKNIDFLIEGIGRLVNQTKTPCKCFIIGDGIERQRLQSRIEDLGLSEAIYLVGSIPPEEIKHYYHISDLFLFASKSETQGMVILEAMAAHTPVVAIRSSGIDDVVHNGLNGYKTPTDVDKWTNRVRELVENEPLRTKLSDQAQEYARGFSIHRFAKNITDIYARVLATYNYHRDNKDGQW